MIYSGHRLHNRLSQYKEQYSLGRYMSSSPKEPLEATGDDPHLEDILVAMEVDLHSEDAFINWDGPFYPQDDLADVSRLIGIFQQAWRADRKRLLQGELGFWVCSRHGLCIPSDQKECSSTPACQRGNRDCIDYTKDSWVCRACA